MIRKAHITLSTDFGELEDVLCVFYYTAEFFPADHEHEQPYAEVHGEVLSAFIGELELPRYMLVSMLTHKVEGKNGKLIEQDGETELNRQEDIIRERIADSLTSDETAASRADDARDMRIAEMDELIGSLGDAA